MVFRWIVNAGLLAVPIGATIGVLVGIESHRSATGQTPLFAGDSDGNGDGGDGGSGSDGGQTIVPGDNGISLSQFCQTSYGYTPPSKGIEYTLNPNQWGWTKGDSGALCLYVTTLNNESYPTDTSAPEFSVTWQYPPGPETAPVHAFPNIKLDNDVLPASLSALDSVDVNLHWTYGVGNQTAASTDVQALTANALNANVAIDMFIDTDKADAQDSTKAKYEVMVWFAVFGPAAEVIGKKKGVLSTQVVNGTSFDLYYGQNSLDQNVLTWLAEETTEEFTGDIAPLITKLFSLKNPDFPTSSDYLGYIGLGSEAFSATKNVTFHVPVLSIDVQV